MRRLVLNNKNTIQKWDNNIKNLMFHHKGRWRAVLKSKIWGSKVKADDHFLAVFRIRIQSGQWLRIQEGKMSNDPRK